MELHIKKRILLIVRACIRILYDVLKLFPIKKGKIVFLSRQANKSSLDFQILKQALELKNPYLKIVIITKRLDKSVVDIIKFLFASLHSLYHMATAEVCVLDSYWPMASLVNHRDSMTVIQMWHAMGKIKKSGYQSLDKTYGRTTELAEAMCMHKGYDVVIAGGEAFNPYYCQSFGIDESCILNIGLPRMDYLLLNENIVKERVLARYPEFGERKVILYAPTFRKNEELSFCEIIKAFSETGYQLIIKPHPNQMILDEEMIEPYRFREYSTATILCTCDYLITDYSAIAVEAAVLHKRTLYYVFDYEEYKEKNGLNLDLFQEMPGCVFCEIDSIKEIVDKDAYDVNSLNKYCERYLPKTMCRATVELTKLISDCIERGKHEGIRQSFVRKDEIGAAVDHEDIAG